MESNVCKKPALAGVCAAQRQIFGPLRGPKIETLGRLSEKSMDFFDSLSRPVQCSGRLSVLCMHFSSAGPHRCPASPAAARVWMASRMQRPLARAVS